MEEIARTNRKDFLNLLEAIRQKWTSEGIEDKPAASTAEIDEFERRYSIRFPDDLRVYFTELYGMDDLEFEDDYFSFVPLKDVKPVTRDLADYGGIPDYREIVRTLPDAQDWYVVVDFLITSSVYAIRIAPETDSHPVIHICGGGDFHEVARSFTEFLSNYLKDPKSLL